MTPRSAARVAEQAARTTARFRRSNPRATHEQCQEIYALAYRLYRPAVN